MTHTQWDEDTLELIARRIAFIDALTEGTKRPHELVETLDVSRSTVSRALRELTDAGVVRRTNAGYVATAVGRLAADRYRSFATGATAALDRADALAPLPVDAPLDTAALRGASVTRAEDGAPIERLTDLLAGADRVRLLTGVAPPAPVTRQCQQLAAAGATVEIAGSPSVRDWIDSEDAVRARDLREGIDAPPYTLLLVERDGGKIACLVVYDRRAVHAVLYNDDPDAVSCAASLYAESIGESATMSAESAVDLPTELREEGFVRLAAALDRREPSDPATAWHTGFGLAEVCAGYAVDRTYVDRGSTSHTGETDGPDGERRELAADLVQGLRNGTAHALVGPPGSGKSTACKLVACRWHESGLGEVFYRESGHGGSFESVVRLAERARDAPGHTLIVVEDAVRPETNAVFRLIDACRDDTDVSVLVDTREREWYETGEFPADARLQTYRTAIETVRMPDVDERECERLVAGFEAVTGRTVAAEPADLLAGVRDADPGRQDDATAPAPGELFLLFHRLAAAAEPDAFDDAAPPTSLEEDVVRSYRALVDAGPDALTVGALVNVLNAAGVGIHPEYVHALSVVPEGPGRAAVDDALSALDGRVLFGADRRGSYRSVHGMWSTTFLRHLLDAEGERSARRHVATGLNAVLALADEAECRRSVRRVVTGETTQLDDIETTPGAWTKTFLRRVLQLGQDHPGLAPLFGDRDGLVLTVPDAAPPSLGIDCQIQHGRMYALGGGFDIAEHAFDRAERALDTADLDDEQKRALRADCQLERSELARKRGNFDAADEYASTALEGYRALDDDRGRASALVKLGDAARGYGDYETASRYIEEGLELHRELGETREVAADLQDLAIVAWLRGDLEDAASYARRALDHARELGHERGRATGMMTLGLVARSRDDLDAAESYTRQALDSYRNLSDAQGEADALSDLSAVLREKGALDDAATVAKDALARTRTLGDRHGEGRCLARLGAIAHGQGDLDKASERLERALDVMRETGDQHGEAEVLVGLAAVERDRGAHDRAIDQLERAVRFHRNAGALRDALNAVERLVDALAAAGDRTNARDWCDEGAAIAAECGIEDRASALKKRRRRLADGAEG